MKRLLDTGRLLGIIRLVLVALILAPGVAAACEIDNKASLFVGGVQATTTTSSPSPTSPATTRLWAPFSIDKAFASGATVSMNELRSDLARTLTASELAAPYRWVFGDGAVAFGHTVRHDYARPGLYRLTIYGFDAATRSWFSFDRALVHIVPPGQVLQANLGYYALQALSFAMSGLMWGIDALLILMVLYIVAGRWKQRQRRSSQTAKASTRQLNR